MRELQADTRQLEGGGKASSLRLIVGTLEMYSINLKTTCEVNKHHKESNRLKLQEFSIWGLDEVCKCW